MAIEKIERTIQYYGLLKIPPVDNNIKWWRLSADIVRPQLSDYRNDKYPVPQGFWGYVQAMYADRVLHTYRINYKNEILAFNIDTDLFLQQNISCSLEAILTTFVNFAIALNIPPIERNNPIKDWRNLSFPIDEFKIRLIAEQTVFKFTYEYEVQETCEVPDAEPPSPPPPPPPEPPTPFPPGTPNEQLPPISPPYSPPTDNDQTYNPDPEPDPEPEPPIGNECEVIIVTYIITFSTGNPINGAQQAFGTYQGKYDIPVPGSGNPRELGIICGGSGAECIQGTRVPLVTGAPPDTVLTIVSVQTV